MICAIQYPSWIQPEIIPGFPFLRWYGFMYLVAFTIAFVLFKVQVNKGELQRYAKSEKPITNEDIIDFFTWSLFGLMLGARIFATLVYEPEWLYWQKPWLIFWPFSKTREWTGLQGMSYHGGFIGCFLGAFLWTKRHKQDFFAWADTAAAGIPLGYTFGRLGNFSTANSTGVLRQAPSVCSFRRCRSTTASRLKKHGYGSLRQKQESPYRKARSMSTYPATRASCMRRFLKVFSSGLRYGWYAIKNRLTAFYFASTPSVTGLFVFSSNTSASPIMSWASGLLLLRTRQISIFLARSKIFLPDKSFAL